MGTEPNTVIVSYQNSINLRFCQCRFCTCVERNPRNQLDPRNQAIHLHDIHCKPYGERNICTRKPSDATCVRGKACNMILAMHGTLLRIIYILRGNLVVTLTSCHFLMTEIIMLWGSLWGVKLNFKSSLLERSPYSLTHSLNMTCHTRGWRSIMRSISWGRPGGELCLSCCHAPYGFVLNW